MITILDGFRYFKSYTVNTKHLYILLNCKQWLLRAWLLPPQNHFLSAWWSAIIPVTNFTIIGTDISVCILFILYILCRYFWRVMEGKIDSWNWLGTKYGIASAMSHKIIIVKKVGIKFSSPAESCHIVCVLKMCGPIEESFPHTQHVTTPVLKSSIPSHKTMSTRNISTAELISHKELIT
jgi:hypothetical protein